jgi:hypothetical protein
MEPAGFSRHAGIRIVAIAATQLTSAAGVPEAIKQLYEFSTDSGLSASEGRHTLLARVVSGACVASTFPRDFV